MTLSYLNGKPSQRGLLKYCNEDFVVREELGYLMSGEGEFVALRVRKNGANTLFVGEKLAKFAGVSAKNMGYAGLKDRHAITEQWFCLQMPGLETPDFSQFQLEGVEILEVTRHHRKIRIGSLEGNHFDIVLRGVTQTPDLLFRLAQLKIQGFPNYFGEQRFGREDNNLEQAKRWAKGEMKVKDRKKRSFYLSSCRSFLFNALLSKRIEAGFHQTLFTNDVLQLKGSHSFFTADENQNHSELTQRLQQGDLHLTAPLIGENIGEVSDWEKQTLLSFNEEFGDFFHLVKQEKMKTARRNLFCLPQYFDWHFEEQGLRLHFYLPAGSYATALVRELVEVE